MMPQGPDHLSFPPTIGRPPKNILLIRWKSIGDVVFTLPALRCLRSNFPDSRITYLTSPEFAALVKSFSVADEIITVDRARIRQFHKGGLIELIRLWRNMARTHYDIVVDLQGYGETAWLSWLTRAPRRWAVVHRPSRAWAYTHAVPRDELAHPVDAQLQMLSECGLETSHPENTFELPPEGRLSAQKLFHEFGLNPHVPTVFIQPFTSGTQKDWPLNKWLALSRRLRSLEIQVLFGGGPADRARLAPALSESFAVAAGTDLLTSCSLAARCALVIGADTGLLHLATALGCRVVLLKHLTAKECPYGHPDWVITPHRAGVLVAEIELEEVLVEVLRVVHPPQSAVQSPRFTAVG
ncbi:MAG TPA: glycosyltransferase family 9 protein [Candidatus Sulfotelmatobacter sp.]|nr:glycosyltransferase family 9 protein [Candidatus Sulfotelmatobacter sp.]